jgi:protoporphyrin/coproporphyrin ferrochelatase
LVYSAHSIPVAMAERSPYERQLRETCRLVAERVGSKPFSGEPPATPSSSRETQVSAPFSGEPQTSPGPNPWELVYQSRSGPPTQPWLGPDIRERMGQLREEGVQDVVIVPIGFLVEHMEVIYDLDIEVGQLCEELGINMVRATVVGSHPRFVQMIRELIAERIDAAAPRLALGADGPWPDECPGECCQGP